MIAIYLITIETIPACVSTYEVYNGERDREKDKHSDVNEITAFFDMLVNFVCTEHTIKSYSISSLFQIVLAIII